MKNRVLLVEDNHENRGIFSTILEYEGYEVVEAADGFEALDRARECAPDVVLLDLGLPDMDGFEVMRRLGDELHLGDVPVLIVTAHVAPEIERRALSMGASRFLTKPIPPRDLVNAVREESRAKRSSA